MLLSEAIRRFIVLGKAQGRSEATLKWYKAILSLMLRALGDRAISSITADEVIEYIASLRDTHQRDGADSYVRAMKVFWAWAHRSYAIPDPTKEIRFPQATPKPQAMSETIFRKLFIEAQTRERAILALLLATGARATEILQIKLPLSERRYQISGKGAKRRFLFWDERTDALIQHWIMVKPESDWLFCTKAGAPLKYNALYLALKRLAKRAGVEKFNPHSIRHLYGKTKTASGENAILLAKLMGHADVNITSKTYSQFNTAELEKLADENSTINIVLR